MALNIGSRIAHYDVTALIGEGGMGRVYQATDTKLNRQVALKILPEAFATDPDRLARFQREAHILASLNHPNIAQIHGIEEQGDTRALVLELVEGPTLADRISKGPIPIDEALPIAKQIAEALEAAHEAGVIHRDLKPANVVVKEDGTVKVLDFGLAKALDPSPTSDPSESPTLTAAATQMGVIMGTAAYMSPEQAKGKTVDRRSDVWAFGAVLYEMLSGRRVFVGDDVSDTLVSVFRDDPDWAALPDDVPPRVRQAVQVCLQKDPKRRVRDVSAIRLAMEGAFETTASPSSDAVIAPRLQIWQRPLPLGLGALLLVLASGLAAWNFAPRERLEVTRFDYDLPVNHQLRRETHSVLAGSPDGRRFVYNTTDGLYLRSLDQLEARLLPGTEEDLRTPFFSPDGESLGYYQRGQLKRLSLSGGAAVVLCTAVAPWGATWASDGTILFGQPEGVMQVSENGGTPSLVVPATAEEQVHGPQLLPGGDVVLFSATNSAVGAGGNRWDEAQVVVHSLISGERTVVVEGGSDARYLQSGHLVYALRNELFVVAFDVERLAVTSSPVSAIQGVARAVATASANYAVSSQGTLMYLAGDVGRSISPLAWVDRHGNAEAIDTIPAAAYMVPRLSPGGERVLVWADGDWRVYDLATGREIRVTTDGQAAPYGGWSHTGAEVAYSSSRAGEGQGQMNLWVQSPGGGDAGRQVTQEEGEVHFDSWSPDGRTVLAHHHRLGSPTRVVTTQVQESDAETLVFLEGPFSANNGLFSPDGRFVAYQSLETGEQTLYIRPYPGPGVQIPASVGGAIEPVWSANGELFYRRLDDYTMMAVEVSTDPELTVGPPRELFPGTPGPPGAGGRARYSVTPDGERFLFSADMLRAQESEPTVGTSLQVNVVLNWIEELKERVPVP